MTDEREPVFVWCEPRTRCMGGNECRRGHDGPECRLCEQHYFAAGAYCEPCERGTVLWFWFCLVVVLLITFLFLHDRMGAMSNMSGRDEFRERFCGWCAPRSGWLEAAWNRLGIERNTELRLSELPGEVAVQSFVCLLHSLFAVGLLPSSWPPFVEWVLSCGRALVLNAAQSGCFLRPDIALLCQLALPYVMLLGLGFAGTISWVRSIEAWRRWVKTLLLGSVIVYFCLASYI